MLSERALRRLHKRISATLYFLEHFLSQSSSETLRSLLTGSAISIAAEPNEEPKQFNRLTKEQAKAMRKFNIISEGREVRPGYSSDSQFACRHCGKRYRWKSTMRRHEQVECGGKEPAHQCPHCPYKAKQKGNLGVHVRKHHYAKSEGSTEDLPEVSITTRGSAAAKADKAAKSE